MKTYIWAFDLSLSCTGISIFDDDGSIVFINSIDTRREEGHSGKLKYIADVILPLKEIYKPSIAIIEKGFTRFNTSTQVIFRVHGLINYLFYDVKQVYYEATMVKKTITGKGNVTKEELRDAIWRKYPAVVFSNLDESDSFAVGLCYLYEKGILSNA